MRSVTHREMRNSSGAILRAVAAGETVKVTNNGRVAAVISPPDGDTLAQLEERGQLRRARQPISALRTMRRKKATLSSAELIRDSRGRW